MNSINTTPKLDPDVAFASVEKMLYSLAWRTAKTYGLQFEDCRSECYYAFVKALNWRYNPNKGTKFSTCVHTIAAWRLRNLVLDKINTVPTVEVEEEMLGAAPPERSESLELIDDLSDDAKEIIELLLETPGEILGQAPTPVNQLLNKVKNYLVNQGKCRKDLNKAHLEIQTRFTEAWAN